MKVRHSAVGLILLVGCASEPPSGPEPLAPEVPLGIRIENATDVVLDDVVVGFPEQTESYGRLLPGSRSPHRAVAEAYRYAYVHVTFGAEDSSLLPFDYVGESLLSPGRYTYRLSWNPNYAERQIDLELVVDQDS